MKGNGSSRPVCSWCGIRISLDNRNRGEDPSLPPMVGVIVCTPGCPDRPEGLKVYQHPDWRKDR